MLPQSGKVPERTPSLESGHYIATEYQMIRSFEVQNFRCFRDLKVEDCKRLNVIVGDNGSGKTALLESLFLPLAAGTEVSVRMRAQRGLDGSFGGTQARIAEAIWGDFFHNNDMARPIVLTLNGDAEDNRRLIISRGRSEASLPLDNAGGVGAIETTLGPVIFQFKDYRGLIHEVSPQIRNGQLVLPETGEDLPNFFQFAANHNTSSTEAAGRFSDLSKQNRHREFVEIFTKEYSWIEDINVEVHGGAPTLFAKLHGIEHKLPLANVSGGINKITTILLTIASRPRSVVSVDEIENGIFHSHQTAIWRGLLQFMRKFDSQLFVSTHSEEWLRALIAAAGDKLDDIALWRMGRGRNGPEIEQFSGAVLSDAVKIGDPRL